MKSFGEHFSSEMCNFLGLQIENPGSDPVISVRTPPKKSFSHQKKKCFQTLYSKHELNLDQARESREEDGGGGKGFFRKHYSRSLFDLRLCQLFPGSKQKVHKDLDVA